MTHRQQLRSPLCRALSAGLFALTLPVCAQAAPLSAPIGAEVTGEREDAFTSHALPIGPWRDGVIPVRQSEGTVTQRAWRIPLDGRNTLELLVPLRDELAAAGFTTIFQCDTLACGGFDFRYGTDVLPEPQMHVDLGDFRFLAAERPSEKGPEVVSVLVSRSATQGFVQVTRVGPAEPAAPQMTASTMSDAPPAPDEWVSVNGFTLLPGEAVVLEGLSFASGKAALDDPAASSLLALRDWLRANPDARVELVGHSDGSGDATANTALSLARAQAVRDALLADGLDPTRVAAKGLGPVQPVADNATAEGRAQNRRVEVILTPTP